MQLTWWITKSKFYCHDEYIVGKLKPSTVGVGNRRSAVSRHAARWGLCMPVMSWPLLPAPPTLLAFPLWYLPSWLMHSHPSNRLPGSFRYLPKQINLQRSAGKVDKRAGYGSGAELRWRRGVTSLKLLYTRVSDRRTSAGAAAARARRMSRHPARSFGTSSACQNTPVSNSAKPR